MGVKAKWLPEDKEAMRAALRQGATLQEVGNQYGITRERVRQLTGNSGRSSAWRATARRKENQKQVVQLFSTGNKDADIAERLGISEQSVRILRYEAGIRRPYFSKWNPELILAKAREWHNRYGYTPAACDWNPSIARKNGQTERVERFYEFGAPYVNTVRYWFGSWSEMIRQSGLPPPKSGGGGHGRYKLSS